MPIKYPGNSDILFASEQFDDFQLISISYSAHECRLTFHEGPFPNVLFNKELRYYCLMNIVFVKTRDYFTTKYKKAFIRSKTQPSYYCYH